MRKCFQNYKVIRKEVCKSLRQPLRQTTEFNQHMHFYYFLVITEANLWGRIVKEYQYE